ncbi:hypothetical protein GA0070624_6448 [Micromonospora rhizosphaerae]|uniref:Uncharacterized protein n=1 Tax=Micromonospora rhizosphaerae TaxID=568872 RepID=A0A1C6TBQ9_9ACTN|nr:hypothetical protein [Micromonospora rhizosphaerae]SCL39097.1 hypothetical protein GA0070624_6448 [Micromonospora rhizosphaerae]
MDGRSAWVAEDRLDALRLDLTITPFATLPKRVSREIDAEADLVRAARGGSEVRVLIETA